MLCSGSFATEQRQPALPCTRYSRGLWQAQRRPIIHTEIAEFVLERVVADRVGLTDQDLGFGRQHIAPVNGVSASPAHRSCSASPISLSPTRFVTGIGSAL